LPWGALTLLGVALALLLPTRADANVYLSDPAPITFTLTPGNSWQSNVQITQYNATALGDPRALERIVFVFQATISGTIGIENLDSQAQTISEVFGTTAALQLAGRDPLAITSVSPTHTASVSLGAWDGSPTPPYIPDFLGTSGTTYAATATASSSTTSSTTYDRNAFTYPGTGTGYTTLTTTAAGLPPNLVVTDAEGKVNPASNLTGQQVTGTLWVYYHTPEPGALALLSLGLAAGLCRRSRRQA
jgi:hypothetical protein